MRTLEYQWYEKGAYLKPADGSTEETYVQEWPLGTVLCDECGQPDNCADCNHKPLTHTDVEMLGGWFIPIVDKQPERC